LKKVFIPVSLLLLVLTGSWIALSCGSGQSQSQLQSMSVSPTAADAKNYPDGQVQFTATGYYENPTHTVTPQPATWVACQNGASVNDVTVTAGGVAQCGAGASGTFTIDAWNPRGGGVYNCPAYSACSGVSQCAIQAVAQLTCP
jgi:hypothetical protein